MPTSSEPAIEVRTLAKRYSLGERAVLHGSLRDAVDRAARRLLHRARGGSHDAGHDLGARRRHLRRRSRARRSASSGATARARRTLLKILSRHHRRRPTARRASAGRVGSLLEVGTGFHPELTGRENIFLNGAILGMRRGEITRKFDEIVAFAEVERFIDTPVKRYSSGMYVRLAFAVAAHLEPEILLVDEVLAVGDASFQQKCIGKMGDVAGEGRTVLFVSHNMAADSLAHGAHGLARPRRARRVRADERGRLALPRGDRPPDRQRCRRPELRRVPARRLEADGAKRQLRLARAGRRRRRADGPRSRADADPLRRRPPCAGADPLPRDRAPGEDG